MLEYRTTHSPRSTETSPPSQPETPCPHECGCNEWVTDWWMPPDPPAANPSASTAVKGTDTAARERATSAVEPSTTTVGPCARTVNGCTERVDRAAGSSDKRTDPVDPCTTTVHRRTTAVAGSKAAQHLRGGLQPSPVQDAPGRTVPEEVSEVRHYRGVPFTSPCAF